MPDNANSTSSPIIDAETQRANGQSCLREALDLASLGWSILPVHFGCKKECLKKWRQYQTRPATAEEIQEWWDQNHWPCAGLAAVLGRSSGLCRVDTDCPAAEALLSTLAAGDLPATVEFTTGRGRGWLYRLPNVPGKFKTQHLAVEGGELGLLCEGSYTVLPPSWHNQAKKHYAWVEGHSPHDLTPAVAPDWLLGQLRPSRQRQNGREPRPHEGNAAGPANTDGRIREGQRDCTLASLAGTMRRRNMTPESILAALRSENEQRCDPPLPDEDVVRIAASIASYPPGGPSRNGDGNTADGTAQTGKVNLTDLGNARRVVAHYRRQLHHCFSWKKWLAWDQRRWRSDDTAAVTRCCKRVISGLYAWSSDKVAEVEAAVLAENTASAEMAGIPEPEPEPQTTEQST